MSDTSFVLIFLLVIVLILIAIIIPICLRIITKKHIKEKIDNYNSITIGMSKYEVMNLLGNNCTTSILKDGTEKCVWKIRVGGSSSGYNYKGVSNRTYKSGYTISMTVKFKNHIVIEKTANNLD